MINGFLRICETIGKGAFCKVKKAEGKFYDDDDQEVEEVYAVKVYNKTDLSRKKTHFYNRDGVLQLKSQLDQVFNEIRIWE